MTSQNNNPDSELYKFVSVYMDKLGDITKDVATSCNQINAVNERLKILASELTSKKKYIWLQWIWKMGVIISPTILFIAFILLSKYSPCGMNHDFGVIKISTAACPEKQ